MEKIKEISNSSVIERERLLKILSAGTFLIFFQAYMIAPLIPRLALVFDSTAERVGLTIPAYMIPYGIATLFFGLFSDRFGRKLILLGSFVTFIILIALTATAQTTEQLIFWRLLTGIGASGVVPLSLALMGALFPYEQRGRPLGWLFGAMAGGMAFGSTLGAILEPLVGWRWTLVGTSMLAVAVLFKLWPLRGVLQNSPRTLEKINLPTLFASYRSLLFGAKGKTVYFFVFLNAVFHSGVFTWLGLYFSKLYGLSEIQIGLAILGYGIPGFVFGPYIGRLADRFGRRWLIPTGLIISALASAALMPASSAFLAALFVTFLSLGYDLTQPLLAGIVTTLDPKRGGQAMGLNVFTLFTGMGLGSLAFGMLLKNDFSHALGVFAVAEFVLGLIALFAFRNEKRPSVVKPTT